MITLGKGAFYSGSSKQKLNTKSSTESEVVALSDALPQVLWFQRFLCAQGYPELPAHIWEDNESTITLAKTGKSCSERSKHIEIRYFWIHDYLKNNTITIQHLHTDAMAADIFTKTMQGAKFLFFRQICLNHDWLIVTRVSGRHPLISTIVSHSWHESSEETHFTDL